MKVLNCYKCNKKIGEISKGGFNKSAVVYCNTCHSEIQSKLIMKDSNYGQNDLTENFFNNIFQGS